jgi:hypothetical protein
MIHNLNKHTKVENKRSDIGSNALAQFYLKNQNPTHDDIKRFARENRINEEVVIRSLNFR